MVDDNSMLRVGLRDTIIDEEDMQPVGEASNGVEALERYRQLRPDVVTMDYRMPVQDGLEATRSILAEFPDAHIVFLSIYDGEEDVVNAWRAGAHGYLSKTEATEKIVYAIREVAAGDRCFPDSIARKLESGEEHKPHTPRNSPDVH